MSPLTLFPRTFVTLVTLFSSLGHIAIFVTLTVFDSSRNEFSGQFGLRAYRDEVVAREYAGLRAQAKVEQTSQGCDPAPRSLVVPPATRGPSEAAFDLEFIGTIESKRTESKS